MSVCAWERSRPPGARSSVLTSAWLDGFNALCRSLLLLSNLLCGLRQNLFSGDFTQRLSVSVSMCRPCESPVQVPPPPQTVAVNAPLLFVL